MRPEKESELSRRIESPGSGDRPPNYWLNVALAFGTVILVGVVVFRWCVPREQRFGTAVVVVVGFLGILATKGWRNAPRWLRRGPSKEQGTREPGNIRPRTAYLLRQIGVAMLRQIGVSVAVFVVVMVLAAGAILCYVWFLRGSSP